MCWSVETARQAREHLDANVLCLGGRVKLLDAPSNILKAFLETGFNAREEKYSRRVRKIRSGLVFRCFQWNAESSARLAKALEKAGVNEVHFDYMDGCFVENKTGGVELIKEYVEHARIPTSAHLMAFKPEKLIKKFEKAGVKEITVRHEAFLNNNALEDCLKRISVKKGVAINPNAPVTAVAHLANKMDSIMSVFPGKGGQEFMESALDKIREAKRAGFKHIIADAA